MAEEQFNTTKTTTQTISSTPNVEPYQAAALPSYQAQSDAVNNQYDAAINSQKTALENAYNMNKTQMERDMAKIPEAYNNALNNQASAYERQRQAFNERAAGSGIGTGTGSQAALAMNVANQGNMASINKAKADAITDAQNKITDLHTNYQNSVAEAVAKNDYERAVQMLNEYRTQAQSVVQTAQAQADEDYRAWQSGLNANNMQYSRSMEQAEMLSKYGDFSGYENLYGADTANNMRQAWIASNPDLAYNTGAIDANRYREIIGKFPAGYSAGGGGGAAKPTYYGGGGGGNSTVSISDIEKGNPAAIQAAANGAKVVTSSGVTASDNRTAAAIRYATIMNNARNGNPNSGLYD